MSKFSFSNKSIIMWLGLIFFLSITSLFAGDKVWSKRYNAFIRVGKDNTSKTPLILIHRTHGTKICEERYLRNGYWREFKKKFDEDADLAENYALYIFQYCSDEKFVFPTIFNEFGNWIDENLADQPPFILAHRIV